MALESAFLQQPPRGTRLGMFRSQPKLQGTDRSLEGIPAAGRVALGESGAPQHHQRQPHVPAAGLVVAQLALEPKRMARAAMARKWARSLATMAPAPSLK